METQIKIADITWSKIFLRNRTNRGHTWLMAAPLNFMLKHTFYVLFIQQFHCWNNNFSVISAPSIGAGTLCESKFCWPGPRSDLASLLMRVGLHFCKNDLFWPRNFSRFSKFGQNGQNIDQKEFELNNIVILLSLSLRGQ